MAQDSRASFDAVASELKEWVEVPSAHADKWAELGHHALGYVRGGAKG